MIACKNCGRKRPAFCLGPDDCDKCRPEKARETHTVETVKADIQAVGKRLLEQSDYRIFKYTIEEPNPEKLGLWKTWRAEVREKIRTCQDGDSVVFPEAPNYRRK